MAEARHRPVLWVTGPDRGGWHLWFLTRLCLLRAGASACRVTPGRPLPEVPADGLVLGGGADVSPSLYTGDRADVEPPIASTVRPQSTLAELGHLLLQLPLLLLRRLCSRKQHHGIDHARDRLETGLLRQALDQGLPVLGICRGAQLLNVVLGGSLHQDLAGYYQEVPRVSGLRALKQVTLRAGSLVARVVGANEITVNGLHHQAVSTLGEGLEVSGTETATGIVQAIEHRHHAFVLGVQWHPELLPTRPEQQALLRALVAAARAPASP